jgi:hypothetical protein
MSLTDTSDLEHRIVEKVDPIAAGTVGFSKESGGIGFANMGEAMQFARIMAISQFAVPKHLRGNVGACMAITIQAVEWKMSPFAVANKSYLVNDRLAYESQLVQAVVLQRAPIVGRFNVAFSGDGEKRQCTVTATLKEGGDRIYTSPEAGKIPVKNSPLWKSDQDQQLFYYAGRSFCRRFFPDVLLGIYTPEELYEETRRGPDHARDVTPKATAPVDKSADHRHTPHAPDPEIITDEMAAQAQAKTTERAVLNQMQQAEALADPTGEKAGELLAQQLGERI